MARRLILATAKVNRATVSRAAGVPAAPSFLATLLLLFTIARDALDNRSIAGDLPTTDAARRRGERADERVGTFVGAFVSITDPQRRARIARRPARELATTGELSPGLEACRREAACEGLETLELERFAFALAQALAPLTFRHLMRLLDREPSTIGWVAVADNQRVFVPVVQRRST